METFFREIESYIFRGRAYWWGTVWNAFICPTALPWQTSFKSLYTAPHPCLPLWQGWGVGWGWAAWYSLSMLTSASIIQSTPHFQPLGIINYFRTILFRLCPIKKETKCLFTNKLNSYSRQLIFCSRMCLRILSCYDKCFTLEPRTSMSQICDVITGAEWDCPGWSSAYRMSKKINSVPRIWLHGLPLWALRGVQSPEYVRRARPSFALSEQNFASSYVL